MNKKLVGHLCLTEPKEFTNHFECAAWWERVLVDAGEYPVYEYESKGLYYVSMQGTIVEDYFQSLWCGSRVGSTYDTEKHAGKHAAARTSFYRWSAPEEFRPLEDHHD